MPPPYCYEYPRPSVTVDLAVFAVVGEDLKVLLIRRKNEPFAGSWALPGGFLEIDESTEAGARRELREETGLDDPGPVAFLGVFGDPGRDPRGRTISVAHVAVVRETSMAVKGTDDAEEAEWRVVRGHSGLAFDHDLILGKAVEWLDSSVEEGPIGLALLPEEFGLAEVRRMFRAISGKGGGAAKWLQVMEQTHKIRAIDGPVKRYRSASEG